MRCSQPIWAKILLSHVLKRSPNGKISPNLIALPNTIFFLYYSSDNFARRPSRCPSNRKLERRSDSEEEDVDVLTSDLDDNFSVDVDFVDAKSPPTKLNGRKIEIIHNKIIVNKNLNNFRKKPAETFSDEDGWTTDFWCGIKICF